MLIIGITGGIGSGKTAVTNEFEKLGIKVVDADVAARTVVAAGKPALKQIEVRFGKGIILSSGELDRAALRKIVFSDPEQRKWLEALTHPLIRNEIIEDLNSATSPYAILVSPLLIESGQFHLTNRVLVVDVSIDMQIERTCKRDQNDETQVKAIIEAQISREERLHKADDIITNNQGLDHLQVAVETLHQQYLQLAQEL